MLARICYQKLKIHLSPSTLVLSIKNSFQFSKTRDMIYIVNYANSLYRLSAHRWSLSHFLFHTFAFTLSLQVFCPRWSLSLSHLHFHTFTPSHFLTLSHFHTFCTGGLPPGGHAGRIFRLHSRYPSWLWGQIIHICQTKGLTN